MLNYLIDIDGTICEDIPNEESHKFADAKPLENAKTLVDTLSKQGTITYFTSREEKDREVTINWLKQNDFPITKLIMEKPRGGNYIWIDNLPVKGVLFKGKWTKAIIKQFSK